MATFDEIVGRLENFSFEFTNYDKISDIHIDQTGIYKNIRISLEEVFEGDFSETEIRKLKDFINELVDNGFSITFRGDQSSLSTLLKDDTVGDRGAVKQINRGSIPRSYDMPNPTVEYVYLPDDINVQKQKFLKRYKEELKNIGGGVIDDIELKPLYPGGPLFAKSARDAENLKIHLQNFLGKPVPNAILRSAELSSEIVGGGKKGRTKRIYKGGVPKYFSKIQQNPLDGMRKLQQNPGYTLAIFANIDGEKIPVSLLYDYVNTGFDSDFSGYVGNGQRLSIIHNILDTTPSNVKGFFPDPYYSYDKELNNYVIKKGGNFELFKSRTMLRSVTKWFQGFLRTADLSNITLSNSPDNAQVGDFYQNGGFIFQTGAEQISSSTNMIRYPDPTRPTVKDSLVKINTFKEFNINRDGTISNIYGRPEIANPPTGVKNKDYPNMLRSERHRILINFYNNPENINIRNITQAIFGADIGLDGAVGYSRDNPTKYLVNEQVLTAINEYAERNLGKQHIIRTLLSSDYLQEYTGINPETLSAEEKDLFDFKEKTFTGTNIDEFPYRFIKELQETGFEDVGSEPINLPLREDLSTEQINEFFFTEGTQPVTDTPSTPANNNVTTANLIEQFDRFSEMDMPYSLTAGFDSDIDYSDETVGAFVTRNNTFDELNANVAGQATQLNKILDNFTFLGQDLTVTMTANDRPFISDEFRHRLTTNMRDTMYLNGQKELIALDVEYVGRVSAQTHAIELGVAFYEPNINQIVTNYTVYHVIPSEDDFVIDGGFSSRPIDAVDIAFTSSLDEFTNVIYNRAEPTNIATPTWRVAETMGITTDDNMNYNFDVKKYVVEDKSVQRQEVRDFQQTLDKSNEPRNFTTRSPQTFYTNVQFEAMQMIRNTDDLNQLLDVLEKYTDELSIANFEIEIFASGTMDNMPILQKIHKQPIQLFNAQENFELKNNRIVGRNDLQVNNVTFRIPSKDLSNGVFQNYFSKIQIGSDVEEGRFLMSPNAFRADTHPSNIIYRIDDVGRRAFDVDNLDMVFSPYTLGYTTETGDIGYYGPPHNAARVPVGSNPDLPTLRQLGRSFAKTKTGKALGTAWKTIDIGETIISKAFAKAQQAALAAGAVGLGAAAAFTAKVWALYEIGNLLVSAGQQIPELYNVIQQRNEILKNGEEWEKQIVEETFWQDYGPQFLEALERAGDRSPAELLSNQIWSFTLNNLRQQSEGQIFEDDLEENFDTMDDIYYSPIPGNVKLEQMQNNVDYDKVFTGYLNNVPEANVIANRTFKLANEVYNR
jgi:hypothetical protein